MICQSLIQISKIEKKNFKAMGMRRDGMSEWQIALIVSLSSQSRLLGSAAATALTYLHAHFSFCRPI